MCGSKSIPPGAQYQATRKRQCQRKRTQANHPSGIPRTIRSACSSQAMCPTFFRTQCSAQVRSLRSSCDDPHVYSPVVVYSHQETGSPHLGSAQLVQFVSSVPDLRALRPSSRNAHSKIRRSLPDNQAHSHCISSVHHIANTHLLDRSIQRHTERNLHCRTWSLFDHPHNAGMLLRISPLCRCWPFLVRRDCTNFVLGCHCISQVDRLCKPAALHLGGSQSDNHPDERMHWTLERHIFQTHMICTKCFPGHLYTFQAHRKYTLSQHPGHCPRCLLGTDGREMVSLCPTAQSAAVESRQDSARRYAPSGSLLLGLDGLRRKLHPTSQRC